MSVVNIESAEQYATTIAKEQLVVVDFFATWCGPCKAIAPFMAKLAAEHTSVLFVKVDVDELDTVAAKESISAMPTFYFYKAGTKVASLQGRNEAKLEALVKQHK